MITFIMHQENSQPPALRILHLEDSAIDHELVRLALSKSQQAFEIERVETLPEFERLTRASNFDVILADYRLPGFTALDAWQILQRVPLQPPFILLSGAIGEPAAVAAIKMGMSDYLAKDDLGRLTQVIRRALEIDSIRRAKEMTDLELSLSQRRLADFAEHLQMTIEQERAQIAREIHDDIGGSLAAVRFDLSWIGRHSTDLAIQCHVSAATALLQQALGASQRIMMNLRPALLDQGLLAAVEWQAGEFAKRTGLKTTVHAAPPTRKLSKAVELVAYRTVQEALTNIVKHADCTQVTIELSDAKKMLTLEVNDNGVGITPAGMSKPHTFGLRGLQERAKTVGGWLDISSQDRRGTSIILSVPLSSAQTDSSQEGQ